MELIKSLGDFTIGVAAFPEGHREAESLDHDVAILLGKQRAGAEFAITDMFFRPSDYFGLVDRGREAGIDIPILPGIMPITNSSQLLRFSDACGAEVPRWVRLRLQNFGDDTASIKSFGQDVVGDLCQRLIAAGVPGLHFYTMNQAKATLDLCEALGRC